MKNFFQLLATNIKLAISKAFSYPLTISILIILFFCIVYFVTTFTRGFGFEKMAGKMNTDIAYSEKTRDSLIDNNKPINYCTQALSNQYYFIKRYKQQHFDLAQQFETNYYAFVLILAISAVVSSILAISIGRTGWQNQSPAMRAAFFGFFFCTSLSGVFIKVFNCAENADKNVTKYFYFTNLQTNIYNVLACTDSLQ